MRHAENASVADLPAAVADTNALILFATGSARLGRRAAAHFAACERQQALVYVPVVVVWECTLLAQRGRVVFDRPLRTFFDDLFSNPAYHPYDLSATQVFLADETRINRDPFDGLICAAAIDLDLPLITRDTDIRASGAVRVIW